MLAALFVRFVRFVDEPSFSSFLAFPNDLRPR